MDGEWNTTGCLHTETAETQAVKSRHLSWTNAPFSHTPSDLQKGLDTVIRYNSQHCNLEYSITFVGQTPEEPTT